MGGDGGNENDEYDSSRIHAAGLVLYIRYCLEPLWGPMEYLRGGPRAILYFTIFEESSSRFCTLPIFSKRGAPLCTLPFLRAQGAPDFGKC